MLDKSLFSDLRVKALKDDNRNIFRAASFAEKAATYLRGFQQQEEMAA